MLGWAVVICLFGLALLLLSLPFLDLLSSEEEKFVGRSQSDLPRICVAFDIFEDR